MYSSGINSNAKRKQTDELTNTIVIKFEKDIDYGNILRKTIHDAIVEQLNVPKFSFEKICFPRSKYFWIIVFKPEFDAKNIIGKWIDFNGKKVKIEDYNRSIIFTYSYKIIWIDEKEDPMNIRRLVLEKLGVKEGTDEKTHVKVSKFIEEGYIDHDSVSEKCDGILYKTGNIIMTIKCNKNIPIKEIKGIHRHEGKNIRIIQYDNVKKCFGCGDEGHLRASCPDAEKYCEKCKKKGHATEKCRSSSYAAKASTTNPSDDIHEDDLYNENGEGEKDGKENGSGDEESDESGESEENGDEESTESEEEEKNEQNSNEKQPENNNTNKSLNSSQIDSIESIKTSLTIKNVNNEGNRQKNAKRNANMLDSSTGSTSSPTTNEKKR